MHPMKKKCCFSLYYISLFISIGLTHFESIVLTAIKKKFGKSFHRTMSNTICSVLPMPAIKYMFCNVIVLVASFFHRQKLGNITERQRVQCVKDDFLDSYIIFHGYDITCKLNNVQYML